MIIHETEMGRGNKEINISDDTIKIHLSNDIIRENYPNFMLLTLFQARLEICTVIICCTFLKEKYQGCG